MAKIIYLISSMGMHKRVNGKKISIPIENKNGFLTKLKKDFKTSKKVVIIPGNSYDFKRNDEITKRIFESFKLSGFIIENPTLIDGRFMENIVKAINESDLIFLGGGYPLEQIDFFNKINLREILKSFNGIIIAQSSGAINSAKKVLCAPEGLNNFKDLKEWEGLGLTDINIEPHFIFDETEFSKEDKIIRNELLKISYKGEIIGLPNGSFIRIDKSGIYEIFGDAYSILKGNIKKINN